MARGSHRNCAICGKQEIQAQRKLGSSFFSKFPLDENRCREWVKAVGNEDLVHVPIEKLHELRYVCGDHFEKTDFNKQNSRLKRTAVPSLKLTAPLLNDEQLQDFPLHIASKQRAEQKLATHSETTENRQPATTSLIPVTATSTSRHGVFIVDNYYDNNSSPENDRSPSPAVPSLHLGIGYESKEDDSLEEVPTKQETVIEKLIEDSVKPAKTKTDSINTNKGGSKEYLSKLVPIAPKGRMIASHDASERRHYAKFLEQHEKNLKPIENKSPEQLVKVLQHDNAIYKNRISELLNNQNKLELKIKELEAKIYKEEKEFVAKVKKAFAHALTPNQVDMMLGKERVWWTDDEFAKAYALQHFSKEAYFYITDTLNYPMPDFATLKQWAAKLGAEMPFDDDENIPPLPKKIKIRLEKIKKDKAKKDIVASDKDCDNDKNDIHNMSDDIKPNDDGQSLSNLKLQSEHNCNKDDDSERNMQSDRAYNISEDVTNIDENDMEVYEQIDYIDESDISDDNNGVEILDTDLLDDSADVCSNNDNDLASHDSDTDEHDSLINKQGVETEYYEEIIIENVSEHEVVIDNDNLIQDKNSVIEEDNG